MSNARDAGYSLIELVTVVVVIGVLAAIVTPRFLRQREDAWTAQVRSDLRSAAVEVEAFYGQNRDTYPTPAEFRALVASGDVRVSEGTAPIGSPSDSPGISYVQDDGQAYCLTASHVGIDGTAATVVAAYDSDGGGLSDSNPPRCGP